MKYLVPICALLTLSCSAEIDGQPPATGGSAPVNPGTAGTGTGTGGATTVAAGTPFGVRTGTPELLPFDVRVRRVANALSVPVTNPMFADMTSKNVQLGDYDHAHGALPDNLWLARRLATWADSLTAVCGSPEMKALFPALPENAPQLIKAAWGRTPLAEETAEVNTMVAEAALPATESYEATCMSIFTAAEFVFR